MDDELTPATLADLKRATARVGRAVQDADPEAETTARRDYTATNLEYQLTKILTGTPALTAEQIERATAVLQALASRDDR